MNARALISRIVAPIVRATEGAFRPGPYYLPYSGGWLPDGAPTNWWQTGMDPSGTGSRSAMVEACVSAYAQTIAMCPGDHWRTNDTGGRERVTNSALVRILRRPNEYQSISDFLMNAVRFLYLEGNAYALALRNDRFEINALHLMDSRQSAPQLAENGEVFYHLAGNDVINHRLRQSGGGGALIVPSRDVLHMRLHTTEHKFPFPLLGETPLMAALSDLAATDAIKQQQIQFYMNQARPSAVLSTDLVLPREKVEELRQRWQEMAKGLDGCGPGGTPILTAGLKVVPWSTMGRDAQLAEVMQLSDEKIALAFRVPLQILGLSKGAMPISSTEALMQFWLATGLSFALNHVEEAFGNLFQLKGQPDEYLELSTEVLLRSMYKDRIEALARGVQGGIYSPNEARNKEGLDGVAHGDEPRVQQQVVPLSAAAGIGKPTAPPNLPTGPHPPPASGPEAPPPGAPVPAEKLLRERRSLLALADEYDRRFFLTQRDFCQDPETGLLCGSEPGAGGDDTGGGKEPSTPEQSAADKAAAHVKTVLSQSREVATELGYDPALISIGAEKSPDAKFILNGEERNAAGVAYTSGPGKGQIKMFPTNISDVTHVKGIAAHEVQHQKFQAALDKHQEEGKRMMAEPGPPPDPNGEHRWQRLGGHDAVMAPDGTLRPPYDKKYPNYQAMEKAYHLPGSKDFAVADGVSDYSFEWWKAWKAGKATFDQATHETLAEMSRLKYESGKFPDHVGERIISWRGEDTPKPSAAEMAANAKLWRDLYRTVEKVYKGKA